MNLWEQFLIHAFLGVLHSIVKNPTKAAELKVIMLEVRSAIDEIYPPEAPIRPIV